MNQKTVLEVKNITKIFPGVKALSSVNFNLNCGEVHVLIGENGAGKSTLAKIIMGEYIPDEGEIIVEGNPVKISSPSEAIKYGISGVHQEFMLVPWLNVAQNIFINHEPRRWDWLPLFDYDLMHKESENILLSMGMAINTNIQVKNLDTARQQMVEICKILSLNPKILILDESTASLGEKEVAQLFKKVRLLKEQGVAIIFISHRLNEVREIGDRVTVLRDGKYVDTVNTKDVTDDDLIKMMVGRSIAKMYPRNRRKSGKKVLKVEKLSLEVGLKNIDLVVKEGEIVGLAGLVGCGRTELVRAIFGVDKIKNGEVFLFEQDVTSKLPYQMINLGMGFIPEDRKRYGLALNLSVSWNTIMASMNKHFPIIIDEQKIKKITKKYIEKLKISTPSVDQEVQYLSGGNQQKVVFSKWLDTESKMWIFDEPTRGIDVGAKVEIHTMMDELVQENSAILMISSDLPEILEMSDRIYVIYQGQIVGHFTHEEATQEKIASLMLGLGVTENAV